jgi:hypothetical protein
MTVRRSTTALLPGQTVAALLLVVLTFTPSIMGRAGFQLIEDTVAERIFPLHRHGVSGEDAYIREFGRPAPFVHPHCHRAPRSPSERTPAELSVAGLVLGPVLCGRTEASSHAPTATFTSAIQAVLRPHTINVRPADPPPQG